MVVIGKAAESGDQSGEARPSKAGKETVLEPADDGLVDTTEALEFTLRQPQSLASAKHQSADQPEPTPGLLIGVGQSERLPRHLVMITGDAYRAISSTRVPGEVSW